MNTEERKVLGIFFVVLGTLIFSIILFSFVFLSIRDPTQGQSETREVVEIARAKVKIAEIETKGVVEVEKTRAEKEIEITKLNNRHLSFYTLQVFLLILVLVFVLNLKKGKQHEFSKLAIKE